MNYKEKLDKIVKMKKINSFISIIAVLTFIVPLLIFLDLFPTLPPVGDRGFASYFMSIIIRSELATYLRIAMFSFGLFIVSILVLFLNNSSLKNKINGLD
jgi:hypothetical protein